MYYPPPNTQGLLQKRGESIKEFEVLHKYKKLPSGHNRAVSLWIDSGCHRLDKTCANANQTKYYHGGWMVISVTGRSWMLDLFFSCMRTVTLSFTSWGRCRINLWDQIHCWSREGSSECLTIDDEKNYWAKIRSQKKIEPFVHERKMLSSLKETISPWEEWWVTAR